MEYRKLIPEKKYKLLLKSKSEIIENLQEKAMSNDYLNKLKEKDNYEDIKEALVPPLL